MQYRDLLDIFDIEREISDAWIELDFTDYLSQSNVVGICGDAADCVASYMVCRLNPRVVDILNFAVRPLYQRQGYGTEMVNILKRGKKWLRIWVPDDNFPMHMFLKRNGFCAAKVENDNYCFLCGQKDFAAI